MTSFMMTFDVCGTIVKALGPLRDGPNLRPKRVTVNLVLSEVVGN